MKKLLAIIIGIACLAGLAGCGKPAPGGIGDAIGNMISGDTTGEVGKAYHTQWFAFRVDSVERTKEYAGYTAAEGKELIDVVVTERNIFGQTIVMGTYDFYMDSDTFLDYEWPLDPLDKTMMPIEFDLADKEEVTYHLLFEVPEGLTDLVLLYTEFNEDQEEGDTFSVKVPN